MGRPKGSKNKPKIIASQLVMNEKEESLEKTKAELNEKQGENESEKIEELLRNAGIGNNSESN